MNLKNNTYTLNFDGSCSKNPGGTGAYGYIVAHDGEIVKQGDGIVPKNKAIPMTNNIAEYYAIIMGFEAFINYHKKEKINNILIVKGDSDLVVKQLNKTWKAHKEKPYYPYYSKANELLKIIRKFGFTVNIHWIPRKQNKACDELSKAYKFTKK